MEKNERLYIRISEKEKALITKKMEQLGISNMSAYARKMLIDGYVIKNECRTDPEIVKELNKIGNNINQIAKQLNSNFMVNENTVLEIKKAQKEIWNLLK